MLFEPLNVAPLNVARIFLEYIDFQNESFFFFFCPIEPQLAEVTLHCLLHGRAVQRLKSLRRTLLRGFSTGTKREDVIFLARETKKKKNVISDYSF